MTKQALQGLRTIPLFAELPDESLHRLAAESSVTQFARGDIVVRQGDKATHVYAVIDGQIGIVGETPNGEETIVTIFNAGQVFGIPAAVMNGPFLVGVRVTKRATVIRIPTPAYLAQLDEDHTLALGTIQTLAMHVREHARHIVELKLKTAHQRLAAHLAAQAVERTGAAIIALEGERRLLAGQLGMTPESLSRAFAGLRQHGVNGRGKRFEIADIGKLRSYGQVDGLT